MADLYLQERIRLTNENSCLRAEINQLRRTVDDLRAIMDPLNRLRQDEGNSVTFICPDQDFNDLPDEAIEVSAEWTGWEPRRFSGRTLAECLEAAETEKARNE